MTDPVPIGLIGPGAIANLHVPALVAAGAELVHVVGETAEQAADFAERHGCASAQCGADIDALLGDRNVAGVVVCTPTGMHASQSLDALRAGKHVLCEVPAATSLGDTEILVSAALECDRRLVVAHTMRYWRPVRELLAAVADTSVLHVIAHTVFLRHANAAWTGAERNWADDVLWHHGAHIVDLTLLLLGSGDVSVHGLRGPDWAVNGRHMDAAIQLATKQGQIASLSLSYHSRIPRSDLLIITEDETYELADGQLRSSSGPVGFGEPLADVQASAVNEQDAAFLQAIRTGTATRSEIAELLPAMRVIDAVQTTGRGWQNG